MFGCVRVYSAGRGFSLWSPSLLCVSVLEVVLPERPDLVLATDIPDSHVEVLVFDAFDVEADGGNGRHELAKFYLVENSGFAGRIEAKHENAGLLRESEDGLEDLAHREPPVTGVTEACAQHARHAWHECGHCKHGRGHEAVRVNERR